MIALHITGISISLSSLNQPITCNLFFHAKFAFLMMIPCILLLFFSHIPRNIMDFYAKIAPLMLITASTLFLSTSVLVEK